ncbi:hypothetical protein [Zavarzinia sp. CC-PAN008]|uniref:hypothetical protein n=1 Tax=Zavarzinia sp. CC-PAN008 TaxID=3243332 RepID=UPI003F7481D2
MRNIQVITAAENCPYSVFAATEGEYLVLFPGLGQDIEFIEDAIAREGEAALAAVLEPVWARRLDKAAVEGIHGTVFHGMLERKRFYPTKISAEMVADPDALPPDAPALDVPSQAAPVTGPL